MEEKRRKMVKGKVENLKRKRKRCENEQRPFFVFVLFFVYLIFTFETTEICLGCTTTTNFTWKKYFTPEKNREK